MKSKVPILIISILTGSLLMGACDKNDEEPANLSTIGISLNAADAGILADIEYTSGFGLITLEDEPLPWSIEYNAIFNIGDELSFKAESGAQSQMSAQITVDDQVVASGSGTHLLQISYIKGLK